jgi:chromosome segregation ATPase
LQDARIEELLEHLIEKDAEGKPTRLAQFAAKVKAYMGEIEAMRRELDQASTQVTEMEARAAAMESQLKERMNLRADLVYESQDLAVRASMSGYAGDSGGMLKQVESKRRQIADFDAAHAGEQKRVNNLKISISTKRSVIRKNRDMIALRMNTIASLLERAGQPDPAAAQGASAGQGRPGGATGVAVVPHARRVRRVRVIRRR